MPSLFRLVAADEQAEGNAGTPALFSDLPSVMGKAEVAEALGVSPVTIGREIARGRLGCVHVGTRVRITRDQLLDYVLRSEVK